MEAAAAATLVQQSAEEAAAAATQIYDNGDTNMTRTIKTSVKVAVIGLIAALVLIVGASTFAASLTEVQAVKGEARQHISQQGRAHQSATGAAHSGVSGGGSGQD
jgi:hypothetical protein